MRNIVIEQATGSSASEIAKLHAVCFGEEAWSEEQVRGSLSLDTTQAWTAHEGRKSIGFLLCQVTGVEREILSLGVHPAHQRQGVAERLLHCMLEGLPGDGVVFLEVAADNQAARALYKKHGFVESTSRKGYYRRKAGAVDAVCYRYIKQG